MDLQFIEKYVGPIISALPDQEFLAGLSKGPNNSYDVFAEAEEMRKAVTELTKNLTQSKEGSELNESEYSSIFVQIKETNRILQRSMKSLIKQNLVKGDDQKRLEKYLDNVKPVYKDFKKRELSSDWLKFEKAADANREAAVSTAKSNAMRPAIDDCENLLNAVIAREDLEEEGFADEEERNKALNSLAESMKGLIGQVDEMNVQPKMKETYGMIGKLFSRAEERFGSDFTDRLSDTLQNQKNKVFLMKRYADNPSYSPDLGFGRDENRVSVGEIKEGLAKLDAAEKEFTKKEARYGEHKYNALDARRSTIKGEYSAFIKGPAGCDPKSMLEWITKSAHVFSTNYPDMAANYTFMNNEKAAMLYDLGNSWLKPVQDANTDRLAVKSDRVYDPECMHKLVTNKVEDIKDPEIRKDVNNFNEKYDRYLKSLSRRPVNECFDAYGRRIDNAKAKSELEYGRMAYTHEKNAPFATVHNLDGVKGVDYVFHMHSGKVDLSASNIEAQLSALKADLKRTDPFWLATNSRQFNDMQTQLSDTLKTFQSLKQDPNDSEMRAKAEQQMEKLAEMASGYSERKKSEYPKTKKGRDEQRFTAASKLTSVAATYVLAPKVNAFQMQVKQLGQPGADLDKMANTFVDAMKLLEKCPKQPDLKNLLAVMYVNVSKSASGAAFNKKVNTLISAAPELKNVDLDKLSAHGNEVAGVFKQHKETLEKATPENQRKVGYQPEKASTPGLG